MPISQRTLFLVVVSLTLGLAPFLPEPHLVGKLRWVAGGGVGMAAVDWLDLVQHGLPWVLLLASLTYDLTVGRKAQSRSTSKSPV